MLEEFENGRFTLNTHQMFSVLTPHYAPEKFTIIVNFGFVFEDISSTEITRLS